jgi:hypothetical protein
VYGIGNWDKYFANPSQFDPDRYELPLFFNFFPPYNYQVAAKPGINLESSSFWIWTNNVLRNANCKAGIYLFYRQLFLLKFFKLGIVSRCCVFAAEI